MIANDNAQSLRWVFGDTTMRRFAWLIPLVAVSVARADDELTPLHPPKPAMPPMMMPPVEMMTFTRQSYYDRWQYYAVDQRGYFRPRVVLSEPVPYYLVDGKPYPLMGVQPRSYIPY